MGNSFVLLLVGILLAFCGGAEGPLVQVGRLLGIAADLGEVTSVAAGHAVNVTGAIAHAATDVITSATSNGLNTAENIWRGIDVGDLEIRRCAGILTLDDELVLEEWLNSSAAPTLIPCISDTLTAQMVAAASSVSLALTSIQTSDETLDLVTSFNVTKVWAQLLPNGRIQVHYEQVALSYEVCWANPLWTQWNLELGSEQAQILRLLRLAILDLPSSLPGASQRLDIEVKFAWPMVRSRFRVWLRSSLWHCSQGLAVLVDATWKGMGAVNLHPRFLHCIGGLVVLILFLICKFLVGQFLGYVTPEQWQPTLLLAILDGAPPEPELTPPSPVEPTECPVPVVEIVEDELETSRSSDGSFAKVSAVRISDEENDSEYSLLLAEESASYGGA